MEYYCHGEYLMGFEDKTALVTGGKRGIGRAICENFAESGANIIIADIQFELAVLAAEEIAQEYGNKTIGIQVDVSDSSSVKEMIASAIKEFDHIEILVNNAGITRDNLIMRMDENEWDDVININLKGAYNCSRELIRKMMKQRYGRIINISSVSGLAGQAGQTNYSASKAGLIGFTKALAREVASRKITVNAVAPGFIPTDLTQDLPDELVEWMMKITPMGRMGSPQEVASAVAFFASDEASYITGQVLSVDGGMMMM
jgi:3-oxoacyl-[acyl-carrier protein] reductase